MLHRNINAEGIEECLQELRGQDKTIETIIKWAIDVCHMNFVIFKIVKVAIKFTTHFYKLLYV